MNFIAKMKHWQIFMFVAAPFFLSFLVIPFSMIFEIQYTSTIIVLSSLLGIWLISILLYILLLGITLDKFANFNNKPDKNIFLFLMIYSICYSLFFILIISGLNPFDSQNIMSIIMPLHIFSMAANLYGLRYNAKLLVSIERNEIATAGFYLGEFFLLWFIPIGIWIIQPRINKIVEER
jgi:hypothetical protein